MNRSVRYAQSFITDLRNLEPVAYQRVFNFVFVEFIERSQLHWLPNIRQLDNQGIFYRFSLDNYLIGIEVRGEIVKFLRVLPMPDV